MSPSEPYVISAPALHAARCILMHFRLTPNAALKPTERVIATLIDVHTKAFRAKAALKEFFSDLDGVEWHQLLLSNGSGHSDNWKQIAEHMEILRHRIARLKQLNERMPRWEDEDSELLNAKTGIEVKRSKKQMMQIGAEAVEYGVSPAALNAARILMDEFDFTERSPGSPRQLTLREVREENESRIAVLIDTCTQMWIIQKSMDRICSQTPWMDRASFQSSVEEIRRAMRLLDVATNMIPSFRKLNGMLWNKPGELTAINPDQVRHISELRSKLAAAKSLEEEQRILREAGNVQLR